MDGWSSPSGDVRVDEVGLCIEGEFLADEEPSPVAPADAPKTGKEGKAP